MRRTLTLAPCLLLVTLACDADDGGGTPDAGSPGPSAQCQSVLATFCDRFVQCEGDATMDDAKEKADCQNELGAVALPCQRALSASPQTPQCVQDLKVLSCTGLFSFDGPTLPGSCSGIFQFAPSPAEQECEMLSSLLCQRILECDPATAAEVTQQECADEFSAVLECHLWEQTTPTLPACLGQLRMQSCAMLFPPPDMGLALPRECGGMVDPEPDPQIDPGGGGLGGL